MFDASYECVAVGLPRVLDSTDPEPRAAALTSRAWRGAQAGDSGGGDETRTSYSLRLVDIQYGDTTARQPTE